MNAVPQLSRLPATLPDRLAALDRDGVVERIWSGDHTVWKDDPSEIANRLGWLSVTEAMRERVAELEHFAADAAADGFRAVVLLGMGGSSLAPEVFMSTFGSADGMPALHVLDTTHPATVRRVTDELDAEGTLFVVASKSGTTTETLSHLAHLWDLAPVGRRFVAITDPGTPLEALARERSFRAVFANPGDIGGRYSALSLFGLVPAALIGIPLHELLDSADEMRRACGPAVPAAENPGAVLGAALGASAAEGLDKLTLVLPDRVSGLGDWIEQLVAESTGKEGVGIVPVVGEPLAAPDGYGRDRIFVGATDHEGMDTFERAGLATVRLRTVDPGRLGGELFRWELATAIAGHVMGINPFDQPNVQEAKDATTAILAEGAIEDPGFDDAAALLKEVRAGDYVAIMAYLDRTPETEDALGRARVGIRDRLGVATTVGFGPRFLHSTGQLHKGGSDAGVFLQVVDAARAGDVPIPGRPYTFGALIDAQALGDLRALRARGRRTARVTLDALREVV
ncbi:MAG: glucose-6-phosphate isomerase [Actinomycetota bacterium]